MVIKSVLREELQNSLRMKKGFERELAKLPRGSLVRRKLKGHFYWYLVFREKGKFKAVYKGKVEEKEIEKYRQAREYRAKYRRSVSQLKKQIRFLKSMLRGKEDI
jgi:hypothetical protein